MVKSRMLFRLTAGANTPKHRNQNKMQLLCVAYVVGFYSCCFVVERESMPAWGRGWTGEGEREPRAGFTSSAESVVSA